MPNNSISLLKKTPNTYIQFVIVDCDNILVNTDTVLVSVMLDVLEEFGIDLPPDDALQYFGGKSLQECITVLKKLCATSFNKDYKTNLSRKLDTEIFLGIEPLEGIHNFLRTLSCPYFLLSHQDMTDIKTKLTLAGLQSFFSDDFIICVPEKRYWNEVLNIIKQNNFEPERGLLIKNRPRNPEIILESGLSLAYPTDFQQDFDNRDYSYENIQELYEKYTFG